MIRVSDIFVVFSLLSVLLLHEVSPAQLGNRAPTMNYTPPPGKVDPSKHPFGFSAMMRRYLHSGGKTPKLGNEGKFQADQKLITEAVSTLTPADFSEDTILQMVKGVNGSSIYKHLEGVKGASVVFRREETNDSGKDVVILSRTQDRLRVARTKRTYVVLKQTSDKKDHFAVFYAYITADDTGKKVEFDAWDARGTLFEKTRAFGWTNCKRSNLVSCKGASTFAPSLPASSKDSVTLEYIDEDDVEIPDDGNESDESSEALPPTAVGRRKRDLALPAQGPVDPLVRSAAKVLERSNLDAKYDYYLDLRNDAVESKLVGVTVNLVTKGATALSISDEVSKHLAKTQGQNGEGDQLKLKVIDALEASVKNFAGSVGIIGLLVGGADNLDKKEGTKDVIGEYEAKLGKRFLEIVLTKGNSSDVTNPSSLLQPNTVSKLFNSAAQIKTYGLEPAAQGRGALGGSGGLLGGLGGILGGGSKAPTKPTKKPLSVAQKRKKLMKKLEGKEVSQKAIATSLMKNAEKEFAKTRAGLPDGYAAEVEKEEDTSGGVPLKSMAPGGLAMLENGDMVHKLPSGGFVLLPKEGGLVHLSPKEITQLYAEPIKRPPAKPDEPGVGLLGGVTGIVSGLLNNVGTVLKGGPKDPKTGKRGGIVLGLGDLLSNTVNNVNDVVNGDAGQAKDEEAIDYQYEGDQADDKGKGRAFDAAVTPAPAPGTNASDPNLPPRPSTTPKPFDPKDCTTRKPGIKTWYDPLGLYPDPKDPCYFAPIAVPTYHWVAPPVPPYNPYGYSYPFYPYFGKRKRRSVPSETSSDTAQTKEEERKKRGWLTGNGSQNGNGCDGLLGIVGWILGNKKGCGQEDTVTITGQTSDMTYAKMNGQMYSIRDLTPTPPPVIFVPPPPGAYGGGAYGPPVGPPGPYPGYPPPVYDPAMNPPPSVYDPAMYPPPPPMGRRKRDAPVEESKVPLPVTRRDILAKVANQLINQVAATAVGGGQEPRPLLVPGKGIIEGRSLIDKGLDILQFEGTGRSLGDHESAQAGLGDQMDVDLFSRIGWLTQDYNGNNLHSSSAARKEVFVGFGLCPYTPKTLEGVTTPEGAIEFYLNVMRTGCDQKTTDKLKQLATEGCLQVALVKGKTALDVNPTCKYAQKIKLSEPEIDNLAKAFEISIFSQAYCAELENKAEYDDGISKSIRTLKNMFILAFKRAKANAPHHYIKLSRSLIRTLKTALTKTLQDIIRLQSCSECEKEDQDGSIADFRALLEIIEYLSTNAHPWKVDWNSYHAFIEKNSAKLEKKFQNYFV